MAENRAARINKIFANQALRYYTFLNISYRISKHTLYGRWMSRFQLFFVAQRSSVILFNKG